MEKPFFLFSLRKTGIIAVFIFSFSLFLPKDDALAAIRIFTVSPKPIGGTITAPGTSTAWLNCGDDGNVCSATITFDPADPNNLIELIPRSSANNYFFSWTGDCLRPNTSQCVFRFDTDPTVSAIFKLESLITIKPPAHGTITKYIAASITPWLQDGDPCNSTMTANCNKYYYPGSSQGFNIVQLRFTATPDPGYLFTGWTDDCVGTGECFLDSSKARIIGANFKLDPTSALNIISPNGGEVWAQGSTQIVKWTSSINGDVVIVLKTMADLTVSREVRALTFEQADTVVHEFSWVIPPDIPNRNDYKIFITKIDALGAARTIASLRPFSITSIANPIDPNINPPVDPNAPPTDVLPILPGEPAVPADQTGLPPGGGTTVTSSEFGWTITNPFAGGVDSISGVLAAIATFIFQLGIPVAVIIIIYAGFLMVTSGGQPARYGKGLTALKWAIIGLAILLIGKGFVSLIQTILSVK